MAEGHGNTQPLGGGAAATAYPVSSRATSSTPGDLLRFAAVPAQYTGAVGTLAPVRTPAVVAAETSSGAAAALASHVEEKASASLQRDPSSTAVPSENTRSAGQLGKSTLGDSSASAQEDGKITYPAMSKCTGGRSTTSAAMAAKIDSAGRAASGLTNVAGLPSSASSVGRSTLRDIANSRLPQPLLHEAVVCGASDIDVHPTINGLPSSAITVKDTRKEEDTTEGDCERVQSCPVECATGCSVDNVSPRIEGEVGEVTLLRQSRLAAGGDGDAVFALNNKTTTPNSAVVPPGEGNGALGGKCTAAVDGGAVGGTTVENAVSHEPRTPFMSASENDIGGDVVLVEGPLADFPPSEDAMTSILSQSLSNRASHLSKGLRSLSPDDRGASGKMPAPVDNTRRGRMRRKRRQMQVSKLATSVEASVATPPESSNAYREPIRHQHSREQAASTSVQSALDGINSVAEVGEGVTGLFQAVDASVVERECLPSKREPRRGSRAFATGSADNVDAFGLRNDGNETMTGRRTVQSRDSGFKANAPTTVEVYEDGGTAKEVPGLARSAPYSNAGIGDQSPLEGGATEYGTLASSTGGAGAGGGGCDTGKITRASDRIVAQELYSKHKRLLPTPTTKANKRVCWTSKKSSTTPDSHSANERTAACDTDIAYSHPVDERCASGAASEMIDVIIPTTRSGLQPRTSSALTNAAAPAPDGASPRIPDIATSGAVAAGVMPICVVVPSAKETGIIVACRGRCLDRSIEMPSLSSKTERTSGDGDRAEVTDSGPSINVLSEGSSTLIGGNTSDTGAGTNALAGGASVRSTGAETIGGGIGAANASADAGGGGPDEVVEEGQASRVPDSSESGTIARYVDGDLALRTSDGSRSATGESNSSCESASIDTGGSSAQSSTFSAPPSATPWAANRTECSPSDSETRNAATPCEESLSSADGDIPAAEPSGTTLGRAIAAYVLQARSLFTPSCPSDRLQTADNAVVDKNGVEKTLPKRATYLHLQVIGPSPSHEKATSAKKVALTTPNGAPATVTVVLEQPGEYTLYVSASPLWVPNVERRSLSDRPIAVTSFTVQDSLFDTVDVEGCRRCQEPLRRRRLRHKSPLTSGSAPIRVRLIPNNDDGGDTLAGEQARRPLSFLADVSVRAMVPTKKFHPCRWCPSDKDGALLSSTFQRSMQAGALAQLHRSLSHESTAATGEGSSAQAAASAVVRDTESGSGTDFGAVGTVETGEKEIDVLDGTPPSIGETVTGPKLSSESSNWNVVGASDSTTMLNQRNTPSRPNSTGETVVPGEPGVRNEPDILSGSPEASVPSEAVFARGLEVAEAEGEMPQIGADVGWDTDAEIPAVHKKETYSPPWTLGDKLCEDALHSTRGVPGELTCQGSPPTSAEMGHKRSAVTPTPDTETSRLKLGMDCGSFSTTRGGEGQKSASGSIHVSADASREPALDLGEAASTSRGDRAKIRVKTPAVRSEDAAATVNATLLSPDIKESIIGTCVVPSAPSSTSSEGLRMSAESTAPLPPGSPEQRSAAVLTSTMVAAAMAARISGLPSPSCVVEDLPALSKGSCSLSATCEGREGERGARSDDVACLTASNVAPAVAFTAAEEPAISGALQAASAEERLKEPGGDKRAQVQARGSALAEPVGRASVKSSASALEEAPGAPCAERRIGEAADSDEARSQPPGEAPMSTPAVPPVPTPNAPSSTPATAVAARAIADTRSLSTASCDNYSAAGNDECVADCSGKCPTAHWIDVGGAMHEPAEEAATCRGGVKSLPETADKPYILPLPHQRNLSPLGFCGRRVKFPIVFATPGQAHQSPSTSDVASGAGVPTGPDAKNDSFPPHQRLGVEKVCLPTDSSAPIVPVNLALLSPWSEGQLESRRSSRAPPSSSLTVASECPRCGARPWLDVPPLASPTECEVCLWRSDSECTTGRGANGQGTSFPAEETADISDVGERVARKQRSEFWAEAVGGACSPGEGEERQSCERDNRASLPASVLAVKATTSPASDEKRNIEKMPDRTGALKSQMLTVGSCGQHGHRQMSPLERPSTGDAFTTVSGNFELWPAGEASDIQPKLAVPAGSPEYQATVSPSTSTPIPIIAERTLSIVAGTDKAAPAALLSTSAPSTTHTHGSAPNAGGRYVSTRSVYLGASAVLRVSRGTLMAAPIDVVATEAGTSPGILPTGRPSHCEQRRDDAATTRAMQRVEREGTAATRSIWTSTSEFSRSEVGTAATIATLANDGSANAIVKAAPAHHEQGEPGVAAITANTIPTDTTSIEPSSTPLPRPNCHDAPSTPIAKPNSTYRISNQRLPLATMGATAGEVPTSCCASIPSTAGAFASSRRRAVESNIYFSANRSTLSEAEWGVAAGYPPPTFHPADRSLVDWRAAGQLQHPCSSSLLPPTKVAVPSSDEPPACWAVESSVPPWPFAATRRCVAENGATNELKNQSAESPASAVAATISAAAAAAAAAFMGTGPPVSSSSSWAWWPRVNSLGAPQHLPLGYSRGESYSDPRSHLRDGPHAAPKDTPRSHPQVGAHDVLSAETPATMASGGQTVKLDVGSSVGSIESTRNRFTTSFISRDGQDGNVRNPTDVACAGTHGAGERQSFDSADGQCVSRRGSSGGVGGGGSGYDAGGGLMQAGERKTLHQSPVSVGHPCPPRNAASTGLAGTSTTGLKRPLASSFLDSFAVTAPAPKPSLPASRRWLEGAAHQSSKRKRGGTVALVSGEESLPSLTAGASPSVDTLVSHAATITVGDNSSVEWTNGRISAHGQAENRSRGCQPFGVAFFSSTGATQVPQSSTGSGTESGGSVSATRAGACSGHGGSEMSVRSELAAPFSCTCARVGAMEGYTWKESSAGAGGGPAGADETVGIGRGGAQAPHPKRARDGESVVEATAGLGVSAGEEGKTPTDRESLVTRGVMNAKILHLLFRCSEGVGGASDRRRRRDDELSRVYCSVGDPLIPDNTTWTAPVAGQPLPFDALFPEDDEDFSVGSSLGEHSQYVRGVL